MIYLLLIIAFLFVFAIFSEEKTAADSNVAPMTYDDMVHSYRKALGLDYAIVYSDSVDVEELLNPLLTETIYWGGEGEEYCCFYTTFNGVEKKIYFLEKDIISLLNGRSQPSFRVVSEERELASGQDIYLQCPQRLI